MASRVASPDEQEHRDGQLDEGGDLAANTGSSSGTLYSSWNSFTANSHERIFKSPELKNTAPIADPHGQLDDG